jgi:RHS repeat-associated protein
VRLDAPPYITGDNLVEDIAVTGVGALSYSYTYDDNKNVLTETLGGGMSGYSFETGYDEEDRLTSWDRDNGDSQAWGLSPVGNWSTFTKNTVAESRTYNSVHELTAIGSNPLTYDTKGNLTQDDAGIGFSWDFDNLLSQSEVPASPAKGTPGTHTYQYDALGRRVAKVVNDATDPMSIATTTTVYFSLLKALPPLSTLGGQVIAEYENGTLAREYVHGEYVDEPLAMIDRTDLGSTSSGTDELFYYHHNRVFNVAGLSDSSGNIAELYAYTPYGDVLTFNGSLGALTTSALGNTTLFTGRTLDSETGLHYFRARYLTSWGFISRDPLQYINGASLYLAYFAVILGDDPSGLEYSSPATLSTLADKMRQSGDNTITMSLSGGWSLMQWSAYRMPPESADDWKKGCVGVTGCHLGKDPRNKESFSNCFTDFVLAQDRQRQMSEGNCCPEIFSYTSHVGPSPHVGSDGAVDWGDQPIGNGFQDFDFQYFDPRTGVWLGATSAASTGGKFIIINPDYHEEYNSGDGYTIFCVTCKGDGSEFDPDKGGLDKRGGAAKN